MSGGDKFNRRGNPELTGFWRYFNRTTLRGRINIALATYLVVVAYYAYAIATFEPDFPSYPPPPPRPRPPNRSRFENWTRVNLYISEGTINYIKQGSLMTLSFVGGFAFYQQIVRGIVVEDKDCHCNCACPHRTEKRNNKNTINDANPNEAEPSKPPSP